MADQTVDRDGEDVWALVTSEECVPRVHDARSMEERPTDEELLLGGVPGCKRPAGRLDLHRDETRSSLRQCARSLLERGLLCPAVRPGTERQDLPVRPEPGSELVAAPPDDECRPVLLDLHVLLDGHLRARVVLEPLAGRIDLRDRGGWTSSRGRADDDVVVLGSRVGELGCERLGDGVADEDHGLRHPCDVRAGLRRRRDLRTGVRNDNRDVDRYQRGEHGGKQQRDPPAVEVPADGAVTNRLLHGVIGERGKRDGRPRQDDDARHGRNGAQVDPPLVRPDDERPVPDVDAVRIRPRYAMGASARIAETRDGRVDTAQITAPEPRAKSSAPPRGYVSLGPFADPSANTAQTRTAEPATMSAVFGQRDAPRRGARMSTIASRAPAKGPNMRESVPMYARSDVSASSHSA